MAVVVKNKNGKDVTLLNPNEKVQKALVELKYGVHLTNNGHEKRDKNGNVIPLTSEERAYRAGQVSMASDSQKAFKHKHPRYKRKTTNMKI